MRSQKPRPAQTKARTEALEVPGVVVGRLAPGSTAEAPQVLFDENGAAAVAARTAVPLDAPLIDRAIATRRGVLLQFEKGKLDRPIIVGLLQEQPTLLSELLAGGSKTAPKAPPATAARKSRAEAKLDGKRVVLEAENEIELRCGDSSITLSRDGKIIVKGAYVETYSRGVNRIKGGAVKIN
jgi:hypothetical protein